MEKMPKSPNLSSLPKMGTLEVHKPKGHLIEGVKPIMVCIGSIDDFKKTESEYKNHKEQITNDFELKGLKNLDWENGLYGSHEEKDFITSGPGTFLISTIDDSNKFSKGLVACISLIVAGVDKKTGRDISFMTHQPPYMSSLSPFPNGIKKRLIEMNERCKPGTMDAIILGGKYRNDDLGKIYLDNINFLSSKTKEFLGFEPIVINGPKTKTNQFPYEFEREQKYSDDVYYDNNNRRTYFVRPKVNPNTNDFTSSNVQEEKTKWNQ